MSLGSSFKQFQQFRLLEERQTCSLNIGDSEPWQLVCRQSLLGGEIHTVAPVCTVGGCAVVTNTSLNIMITTGVHWTVDIDLPV